MNTKELRNIGTFRCDTDKMYVSDPCYSPDTWCQGEIEVEPGTWEAYVQYSDEGDWGIRVAELIIANFDHDFLSRVIERDWEGTGLDIGVDSGQAGFFAHNVPIGQGEYGEDDTFYGAACNATNGEAQAAVILNGVVSRSGYGDGGYELKVVRNKNGKVIAARIIFIGDEENDEH